MKTIQEYPSVDSILLCLDLEKGTMELAYFCADCARSWSCPVRILHVLSESGRAIEDVEAHLKHIVDEMSAGISVEVLSMKGGLPEESIIEYAREKMNNPIIMLGRRKRRIADRIYVGSTTSAVISLSDYPVMVVPLNS